MTNHPMTPSTGPRTVSRAAGSLAGGKLLAVSGLFSRIRRWVTPATGLRDNATHGNKRPPAQPNPVGFQIYALLRRRDGQLKRIAIRIPRSTPPAQMLATAYWDILAHPDALAFDETPIVEQIEIRPRHNCHLRTTADEMTARHNADIRVKAFERKIADPKWRTP